MNLKEAIQEVIDGATYSQAGPLIVKCKKRHATKGNLQVTVTMRNNVLYSGWPYTGNGAPVRDTPAIEEIIKQVLSRIQPRLTMLAFAKRACIEHKFTPESFNQPNHD